MQDKNKSPVHCVGIVCFRDEHVLLIKRGKAPRKGQWSIPGGRIEPGESEQQASKRELFEETGVTAKFIQKIEAIDADFGNGPYRLHDYVALWQHGEPVAGDDAALAEFIPLSRVETLGMWSETTRVILKGYKILSEIERFKIN